LFAAICWQSGARRGISGWLAYGAALSIGAVVGLVSAWLAQELNRSGRGS